MTMSSGHDVSEYELGASGLPPMFHHNNRGKIDETPRKIMIFVKKKNSWYGSMTPPEDRVISMFAELLVNHDSAHSQVFHALSHPVYVRRVDPPALAFTLSSHRHSHISLLFSFRFID